MSELDLELDLFREQLYIAKRRRNSINPICHLPPELLAVIFLFLKEVWQPSRVDEVEEEEEDGPSRYSYAYNWITVTHVCHSWRSVRLNSFAYRIRNTKYSLGCHTLSDVVVRY